MITLALNLVINTCIIPVVSAATTFRAASLGIPFSGASFLGVFCGSFVPSAGVLFLCGSRSDAIREAFTAMPIGAFFGSLLGIIFLWIFKRHKQGLFFWLDSVAMSVQGIFAVVALPILIGSVNPIATLSIGVFSGLAPGMMRDVLLGDVAMAVECSWYASALTIGCIAALSCELILNMHLDWFESKFISFILGITVVILLRRIFGYRLAET